VVDDVQTVLKLSLGQSRWVCNLYYSRYEWKRPSNGGEIPPSAVQNLLAALMADLNGDGTNIHIGITA
jgi:hypothetical protein